MREVLRGRRKAASGRRSFGALRSPAFATFWAGLALALTGQWMRILVQGYFVFDRTHDPFQTALVPFFQGLPVLLLSPVAGIAADRFDRRRLLAVIQLALAVPAFGAAVLSATGRLEVWHVYLMALLIGSGSAFDWPARLSLAPNLVPREDLQSAVALNAAAFNFSRIIGPALGGLLIAPLGVTGCLFLAAAAYLPFVVALLTTIGRARLDAPAGRGGGFAALRDGYAYIWGQPVLRSLLSIDLVPVMIGMTYFGLLPVVAADVLGQGSTGLGILQACAGVGALAGVLLVASMSGVRGRGKLLLSGVLGFGVALALFGQSTSFALSCGLLIAQTVLSATYGATSDTLLQEHTEDRYRGRVNSVYSMIWGLTPIGNLEGGILARLVGVQTALTINGLLVIVFALVLWRFMRVVRELD